MHLIIAEREGLRRSQREDLGGEVEPLFRLREGADEVEIFLFGKLLN